MLASQDIPVANILAGIPGHWQVVIIVLAVLILFGGKKLPELARGLGRGLRLFKQEMHGMQKGLEDAVDDVEQAPKPRKQEKPDTDVEA